MGVRGARYNPIHKKVVTPTDNRGCQQCGGYARSKGLKQRLFQYNHLENGETIIHGGLFCSLDCHNKYHKS